MIPKLRLLAQSLFLLLSLAVFFGLITARPLISFYNSMHIFPALSALAWLMVPPSLIAALLFLLLPLGAGRLYCSFLCPAGFFQDQAARLGRILGIRQKPVSNSAVLRFFILAAVVAFIVLRSSA